MDNTSLIKDHFLSFWHHFLFFEIMRSKKAIDMIGNANGYLVFQVIAWHHILILTSSSSSILRDEAVKLWYQLSKSGFESNTVLTYTLISELTSLSIETVRRQVKKLEENNWVSYSKKEGVKYNPNEENNNFLAGNFNVMEVEGLGQLLDVIEQKTTSKE
jgi:hypothetical protein|tara:strand:+ start:189 stop:668 length:480 start_codon:yes stop_codon:yes gene_type:complete